MKISERHFWPSRRRAGGAFHPRSLILLLVTIACCLSGCGSNENNAGAADDDGTLTRAASYRKQGQYRAALIELRKASQAGANAETLAIEQARILNDLGQHRSVIAALEQVDPGKRTPEMEVMLLKSLTAARKFASAE